MSSKDMFRKEQRFSFRKFSFGLASAVIANVIFGGAIASSPVVHANTATETAAVATSERIASIPYTVNIVDQTGKVVETKEKKVLVYTVETIATATEYLTADLVPEGYAIVSGLGEVTLTENAENVFTVKVDKIAPEAVATTTTAESATSETSTAAATPEPASLTATQPTPVTSEVAEAEVAPTTSEESAKPAERTVYLSYITHYVNEANETVDRTGHLVAVTTTDDTAKTQVTVSASENMPSGWELVQDKAKVVVQLVENQTNILVFAVTKKSKEEEIAASQLSNKDVLEQVLSEGVLLSNDAARLLETSQAGNTGLEVATNNTKAVLKEAIQVFDEPSSTQEQVDAQTELVRAASKTLADELLKFDEDGVLTAMLDATTQGITITTSSTGAVRPNYSEHIRDFATNTGQQSYNNQDFFFGLIGKELTQENSQIRATAQASDASTPTISIAGGGGEPISTISKNFGLQDNGSGVLYGTVTIPDAGDAFSWQFKASSGSNTAASKFTFVPYTVVKTDEEPVRKAVTAGVTADEILAKVKSDVTRGNGTSSTNEATAGPLNIAFEQHFNSALTARATGTSTTVADTDKTGKQIWHEIEGEIPTTAGTHTVTVRSTNVHGQTIDTQVVVDLYEIIKIPSSASETAPQGYVTVTFGKHKYTRGFTLGTQTGETVKVFVKNGVKWGELLDDPAWKWPTVKTDEGDTVVGWSVNDYNYKPGNAFARDNYKDTDVTNITLYPNVVFEVEDVNGDGTKKGYLTQYGPDEQNKWIFITFDAGKGQLKNQKKSKMVAVSKNLYSIDFSNKKFKEKVESPTLQGHTFVRWQTEDGVVLPESGKITTDTTYKALYLAHPTDKTVVFDANKLTDTEKDSLKQAINNANTDSANFIQSITVSDTGEAKVTYNDGTVVTVPASHLINEDKNPARNLAKAEIDKASKEKVAEINASALTDEEKAAKLTEVQEAKDRANNAIDNATTTEDLTKALEDGKSEINAINTTTSAEKAAAKQTLQEAYNAKKDAITNSGLTAEEKDAKQAELDKAKEEADKAIEAATDNAGVAKALEDGKTAIAGIDTSTSPKKAAAKEELKAVADDAKKAIDANDNLTDAEKQAAKDAVDAEVAKAEKAIDAATKADEVDAATLAGEKAVAEDVLDAAKQDAKNKIDEDVKAAREAIDNDPNLSEDEKQTFKDAVDEAAQTAKGEIDKAKTPAEAQTAEEAGTAAIAEDVLDAAKQDAKNKIDEDVKAAREAIDNDPNLSEDEKQTFKDAVDEAAQTAKGEIDKAKTPAEAQTAEEAGTAAIAEDVLDAAKQDAKNKIAKDLATVEAAIDANSNLSDGEKEVAKLAAQAKAAEAVANIEKATTPEAVQTLEDAAVKDLANIEIKAAYDDAVKAIEAADNLSTAAKTQALEDLKKARQAAEEAIKTASTADEVAKGALDGLKSIAKVEAKAAADDAKAAIANNSNLTDDEKKVYTDAIDAALKETEAKITDTADADTVDAETVLAQKEIAKQEVAAATADAVKGIEANANLTDDEKAEYKANVAKAAADAEKAIKEATKAADIQSKTFDATQDVAKEEVKADAADAIAGIKANDNLSDTAKEEAIAAIEEARDTTLENIENAKTAADVDTATLDAEKANAKAEIKAAADDAKKAIDENANLPASDKNALKLAIDAEVAATNLEIDNAKTAEEIDAATLATEKSIAKAEVKAAAEDALQAIDENANLTDDEKAAAKADVYVELSKAEKAIDKATTADAIDNATLVGEKAFATAELEAAADDAKKAIDANTHLTDDQKQAAKDAVDAELAKAKEAVVAAKTADEVDAATLVGEKAVAKEEIKAAAEDAKKAIDANSNLTDDEKAAAKAAVDTEVAKANEAIDKAATADAVDTATLVGEKAVAKEELKAAADDAKKAIDENANLTPEEKVAAKKAVDAEVAKANDAIDAATKAEEVDTATLAGEKAVAKEELKAAADDAKKAIDENANLPESEKTALKLAIDAEVAATNLEIDNAKTAEEIDAATLVGEKAVAKEEVKAAAEDALRAIDENANLTDDEKAAAKADVYVELSKAEKAIDKATTADAIDNATLVGEKAFAKEELEAAADDAKAAIDANDNLTPEEKAAAKAAVDAEVAKANDAIDAATKADEVDAATLAGEKAVAKEELKAAAEDAKAAIDANDNLTDAEKAAAKDAVDAEVAKANEAIDAATKADEVDAATLAGEKAVAKEELKAAVEDAKKAIDANDNLTDAEKAAAKDAVDAEVAKANEAIDAATKADEVDAATLAGEKAVAKEELKAAADDAKAAIDANDNLTDAEKQAAKDAVDAEVAKANEAIDAATKADEVDAATLVGEKAFATAELEAAADDAKKAIDANDNLTDAEKAAAKKAVDDEAAKAEEAIDAATKADEVDAATLAGEKAVAKEELKAAAEDAKKAIDAAKQGAKNKLMEEAEKAKAAIDANPNLTPEEKAAAKAEIDKAVEEAIISINGAGTHHALGEIKLPLSALIKPVVTVTPVLDPNNLTEEEIARIKALLEENNTFPEGTEIIVSKGASVSIKYPDGSIDVLTQEEVVRRANTAAPQVTVGKEGSVVVTPSKEAVELIITYVDNNGKAQLAIVTKGADGKWTTTDKVVIVDPIAGHVIIPGSAIKPGTVVTAYSKDMAGNVSGLGSAEVEAVDANNPAAGVKVKSAATNANKADKKAKQLPNTGEKATSATSLGLAVLGMGLALFAAKRKKDEEEA
ncbi:DUF1542 domain-containing protein [Streptococcus suis]|uniref:DUF1542 domain-containing protein n=1 Tax=Streptococcus suis TaxID=1307 RepID=UPI001C97737B|nr:DUF1542 domain-containing protein [Streptococcus suis]MBY4971047.1 GA module-containing protein [Streptococcus suis]